MCLAIRDYKEENRSSGEDVLAELKTLKKAELLEILEELVEKRPSVHLYLKEKFADPSGMDEAMADGMLELMYPHLLAEYPHEVNEIYTNYIYRQIERASNRKAYWTACQKIKDFNKALGADPAAALTEELKFMYPKRTAFLYELGNVE